MEQFATGRQLPHHVCIIRQENMKISELWDTFRYELDDLREQCVEEGNDPEGDIFDSMADELYKRYMEAEKKCEDYSDYY